MTLAENLISWSPNISKYANSAVRCWFLVRGEEPDEVQQGQGQGAAPGEEQPQAPVKAGADLLGSSSVERDWECWGTTG